MDTNDPPPFGETTLPSDPAVMFIRQHINNIRPQFEAQEAAKRHSERTALERENAKLKQDAQSLQQKFRELQETMRDIDEKSRANNEKLRANNEKLRALDEANVSEADKNTRWERAVKAAACGPGLAQESTPLELCSCDQHESQPPNNTTPSPPRAKVVTLKYPARILQEVQAAQTQGVPDTPRRQSGRERKPTLKPPFIDPLQIPNLSDLEPTTPDGTRASTRENRPLSPRLSVETQSVATETRSEKRKCGIENGPQSQGGTTQNPPKRARHNERRTIHWDEVYGEGNPKYRHWIIPYEGKWYIIRCDKCGLHFADNPLARGGKHILGKEHGCADKSHCTTIRELGLEVLGCDEWKARLNNDELSRLLKTKSYIPRDDRQKSGKSFQGIMDPKAGELYRVVWNGKSHHAALVLPMGNFQSAGVTGGVAQMGKMPDCYVGEEGEWAAGYQDGGLLVRDRQFPVMYFDEGEQPSYQLGLLLPASSLGWAKAKDLRPFDLGDPACQRIKGYKHALYHLQSLERRAGAFSAPKTQDLSTRENERVSDQDDPDDSSLDEDDDNSARTSPHQDLQQPEHPRTHDHARDSCIFATTSPGNSDAQPLSKVALSRDVRSGIDTPLPDQQATRTSPAEQTTSYGGTNQQEGNPGAPVTVPAAPVASMMLDSNIIGCVFDGLPRDHGGFEPTKPTLCGGGPAGKTIPLGNALRRPSQPGQHESIIPGYDGNVFSIWIETAAISSEGGLDHATGGEGWVMDE